MFLFTVFAVVHVDSFLFSFVAVGVTFCLELTWVVVDNSAHTTVRYNSGLLLKILLEINVLLILVFHKCSDVSDF